MQDDPQRERLFTPPDTDLEHHRSRLWLSHGVSIALILVAVLNPVSLERWAAANPPSWAVETVRLTVGVWAERMQMAGFNAPRDWVSERWNDLKRISWEDVSPAQTEEADAETPAPPATD